MDGVRRARPSSDEDRMVNPGVGVHLQSTKGRGEKQCRLEMVPHPPTLTGGVCPDRSMPGLFHATYSGHLP